MEAFLLEDLGLMARAKNYFAWQYRTIAPWLGARVLDCGCGIGNLTGMLLDREAVIAVDKEPECIARVKGRYGGRPNLRAEVCDIAAPEFAALARLRPDSCVCSNVLEHIEDDRGAVRAICRVLAPHGRAVLLVPAFQALYGPIDHNLGHRRRYSRAEIVRLAEGAGLRVRSARYMNLPGWFGWWVNARFVKREAQSAAQIEVFDRVLVPVISRLERLVPPPFGQSLVVVAEKV